MKLPKTMPFDCAACHQAIRPRRLHLIIAGHVVCGDCAGTTAAHGLTGCSVDWHDGWDHSRPCSDRLTATVVADTEGIR